MGLFRRGDSDAQRAEVSEDEPDHQDAVIDLLNDFHEHDMTALAGLSPAQRADQLAARQRLCDYVEAIWDEAKERGLSPADLPEYNAVAAMRDLANELVAHTVQAQETVGEVPDDE